MKRSRHLEVENGHRAVRQSDREHVRVLGVDVHAHDPAMSPAEVLRIRRVLQGVDAHHALFAAVLLVKVVWKLNQLGDGNK